MKFFIGKGRSNKTTVDNITKNVRVVENHPHPTIFQKGHHSNPVNPTAKKTNNVMAPTAEDDSSSSYDSPSSSSASSSHDDDGDDLSTSFSFNDSSLEDNHHGGGRKNKRKNNHRFSSLTSSSKNANNNGERDEIEEIKKEAKMDTIRVLRWKYVMLVVLIATAALTSYEIYHYLQAEQYRTFLLAVSYLITASRS